ncbi:arginyltransferase [Vandammella animalimorsus]|uniref:Aspartate/glutamate leucyltransferase n=1 Tax=Vandammella animalimorsus TaxID=2029117 RepID=A0A2A2T5H1_9BURK|nr:arginyltransferase [Vandammella animalimorsus]PAT30874.1 arginyltransferase [Vandammella animalimorsus]PAX16803.1 arginyltransferase [Vandammella animalimorsus]PAX20399.1 arginyltransferase [Vandammella animalimorsus]
MNQRRPALQLYATAPYPCSYLPGQMARSQVVSPGELVGAPVYDQLIAQGFRRSGLFTYRPHCDHCQACQTLRIPVAQFRPNRSQRRTWQQHRQLSVRVMPPLLQPEHFALYQRYLQQRHGDGQMEHDSPADYEQFLLRSHVHTRLLEFSSIDPSGQEPPQLRMVSVVDLLGHGISAVYTFYDAASAKGLGTWAILWQIQWARQLGLPYLYLGYWIAACPKMAYKARFVPHEVLVNGRWQQVDR